MAREKKQSSEPPGAPGWLVTYGDMMSLLLCFFVLLLSFSTISEEDFNQAMGSLQGALGVLPRFSGVLESMQIQSRQARNKMEEAARRLRRQLQVVGKEQDVKIEYDALGGLKISLPSAVLFDSGSATLRPEAYPVLQDVAEVLGDMPDTFIEVRGHTDTATLINAVRFRDNYDLSYFRADAVARQLNLFGAVPMEQFEIIACGPSQPLATNNTEEGRRANRRVEIYVRGLVDRSRMESLREEMRSLGGPDAPAALPVSPRELDEMR